MTKIVDIKLREGLITSFNAERYTHLKLITIENTGIFIRFLSAKDFIGLQKYLKDFFVIPSKNDISVCVVYALVSPNTMPNGKTT